MRVVLEWSRRDRKRPRERLSDWWDKDIRRSPGSTVETLLKIAQMECFTEYLTQELRYFLLEVTDCDYDSDTDKILLTSSDIRYKCRYGIRDCFQRSPSHWIFTNDTTVTNVTSKKKKYCWSALKLLYWNSVDILIRD